jgi:hypothetical protein
VSLNLNLATKKIGMCKGPKRFFWEKLHKQKYYTNFFLNTYFLLIHMLVFITLDLYWTFYKIFHNIKFNKKVKTHYGDPLQGTFPSTTKDIFCVNSTKCSPFNSKSKFWCFRFKILIFIKIFLLILFEINK